MIMPGPTSRVVRECLDTDDIETWVQSSYSPDLQPNNFNCFGSLKHRLSGNRYATWLKQAISHILMDSKKAYSKVCG
ncbi:unnamed protein product [Lasius platythorax]|uniref:Transposase n=1 Tax=Lasius platythorax TaxID=488582 RepID=A0AAV2NNS6_9HYME